MIRRRDSLAPMVQKTHQCGQLPDQFPANNQDNNTPDELFFPTDPPRIIKHSDGRWYLIIQEEFVIPINHCPFCGLVLDPPVKNPPPPVELDDDEVEIEIEAD